ncbi:Uncharacterised protein [Mycobacteroides abscessus subsp. abscessus]|nr:Uncharacterised protein [Mycobacteroides abscessus subsp. abscessus]
MFQPWPRARTRRPGDTPGFVGLEVSRPGNFMNVVQNILYEFRLSDTRCSVWNTERPGTNPVRPARIFARTSGQSRRSATTGGAEFSRARDC